jgi:hypothetical protein
MYVVVASVVLVSAAALSLAVTLRAGDGEPFVYNGKGKRDPFIPLIRTQVRSYSGLDTIETVEDVNLEGIIWDPAADSIAILNGVIVREGDVINNVTIVEITPQQVRLLINEEEFQIYLEKKEE